MNSLGSILFRTVSRMLGAFIKVFKHIISGAIYRIFN